MSAQIPKRIFQTQLVTLLVVGTTFLGSGGCAYPVGIGAPLPTISPDTTPSSSNRLELCITARTQTTSSELRCLRDLELSPDVESLPRVGIYNDIKIKPAGATAPFTSVKLLFGSQSTDLLHRHPVVTEGWHFFPMQEHVRPEHYDSIGEIQVTTASGTRSYYFRAFDGRTLVTCVQTADGDHSDQCADLSASPNSSMPRATSESAFHISVVREGTAGNAPLGLAAGGISNSTAIVFSVGDTILEPMTTTPYSPTATAHIIRLEDLGRIDHGAVIAVEVVQNGRTTRRYARYRKTSEPYGIGPLGLWIPYGLLATSGAVSKERGITLLPAPVGLAAGVKWFTGPAATDYIGTSLMVNWQFVPERNEQDEVTGAIDARGITLGLLIDFYDHAYVGFEGAWNIPNREIEPLIVIGLAPAFERLLKGF